MSRINSVDAFNIRLDGLIFGDFLVSSPLIFQHRFLDATIDLHGEAIGDESPEIGCSSLIDNPAKLKLAMRIIRKITIDLKNFLNIRPNALCLGSLSRFDFIILSKQAHLIL